MPRKIPIQPGLWKRLITDLRTFTALIVDLLKGRYKGVSWRFVIALACFCAYLVLPIDVINDAIPLAGQLDDTLVFVFLLYLVEKDLAAYRRWREHRSGGK